MGLRILLVLVTLSVAITDQISAAGSWSVESVGWSMYLKPDGSRLTGMVSQCGTARQRLTDIEEGRVDGNKVSFKCTRIDRNLTLQFTGQLLPDAMVINWTKTLRAGTPDTPGVDKIFGAATSGTFTAARITDGELLRLPLTLAALNSQAPSTFLRATPNRRERCSYLKASAECER